MKQERLLFALLAFVLAALIVPPGVVSAEPCLIVYPTGRVSYHYDSSEYYTVGYGHPLYNSLYDRGGKVLLTMNTNEIPLDIYQTPGLIGFEPSTGGNDGYFFIGSSFDLIVDGWSSKQTTYINILLVFVPQPGTCHPIITVNGNTLTRDRYPIGDLVVLTPTENGHNYSDTEIVHITWSGCEGVRIWAFADENYNGVKDGGECFTAFSHDLTVPTQEQSWGAIKALYE